MTTKSLPREELFKLIYPENGFFCVTGLYDNKSKPPKIEFFDTYDDKAFAFIDECDAEGREVYFSVASFKDSSKKRDGRNVNSLQCFFLDVDTGKATSYTSKKEAVAAMLGFCDALQLAFPAIVDSGNGLHCYWPLTQPLDYNAWKPIAEVFKQRTRELQLKSDLQCTADAARILRVPGTTNKRLTNNGVHKPVVFRSTTQPISVEDFCKAINYLEFNTFADDYHGDEVTQRLTRPKKCRTFKFSRIYNKSVELVDVIENEEEKYLEPNGEEAFRIVRKKAKRSAGCPQIAYCVANREHLSYDMWRGALSVAQCCIDKATAVAAVSQGYGTQPEEWHRKAEDTNGAYHCTKWATMEQGHLCTTCIHRGKFVTPLSLGIVIEEAQPEDNIIEAVNQSIGEAQLVELPLEYPYPWLRPKTGGVAIRVGVDPKQKTIDPNNEPDETLVWEHDFWVTRRTHDTERREILVMARHLPHDGLLEFSAPTSKLMKDDTLREILSERGITAVASSNGVKLMKQYIKAWSEKLLNDNKADKIFAQFGWHDNNRCFVVGNREIERNGIVRYSPLIGEIVNIGNIYTPKGTIAKWREVTDVYALKGNEARAFALFCSFGAPLYKFIGEGSMTVHLTNTASGVGKSTAQKVACSVWGDPQKSMLSNSDTFNAKMHRAGILHNIPVCVDEVTNMAPDDVSRFAFDVSAGRGRNRMAQCTNEERVNTSTWETIFITSGNNSLHDAVRRQAAVAEGEIFRILEIPMPLDEKLSKREADKIFGQILPHNYGHAGDEFMKYVVHNLEFVLTRLKANHARIDDMGSMSSKERFYSSCIAAAITGAEIANELGLINIPVEPVLDFVIDLLCETRKTIKEAATLTDDDISSVNIVVEYWNQHLNSILVTNSGTSEVDGRLLNQAALKPVNNSLLGRYDKGVDRLYVDARDFRTWISKQRMVSQSFYEQLKDCGALVETTHANLGDGTALYGTGVLPVLVFNTVVLNTREPDPTIKAQREKNRAEQQAQRRTNTLTTPENMIE